MNTRFLSSFVTAPAVLVSVFCLPGHAAEVYRWVDDKGKVHFSDGAHKQMYEQKKQHKLKAEAVSLQSINSVDPTDSFSDVYAQMKQQDQNKAHQKQQAQLQQAAMRKERDKACKKWVADYNRYGARGNVITYMEDDNGKALTERQQQKELEKIRRKLSQLGCL